MKWLSINFAVFGLTCAVAAFSYWRMFQISGDYYQGAQATTSGFFIAISSHESINIFHEFGPGGRTYTPFHLGNFYCLCETRFFDEKPFTVGSYTQSHPREFAGFGWAHSIQLSRLQNQLTIPYWAIIVLNGIIPARLIYRSFKRRQRDRRLAGGLCVVCGYDLRASRDRCPECGTPTAALSTSPTISPQTTASPSDRI